jgi:large subunit ribosomal protein L4
MPNVKLRDLKNEEVGEISLSDTVFGVALNEALIHEAVRHFLANRRAGTVATKTRGDVSGSGRKLWRQKGTGRARIASLRSPLWRGGGNTHGPQPRDWSYNLPKKMKRGALRSALSERVREGNLLVIDEWKFDEPKTKEFIASLDTLKLAGKTLIVDSLKNRNLVLASRNVRRAKVVNSPGMNIYDLLYHDKLVLTPKSVKELTELLTETKEAAAAAESAAPAVPEAKVEAKAKPRGKAKAKPEKTPKRATRKKKEAA